MSGCAHTSRGVSGCPPRIPRLRRRIATTTAPDPDAGVASRSTDSQTQNARPGEARPCATGCDAGRVGAVLLGSSPRPRLHQSAARAGWRTTAADSRRRRSNIPRHGCVSKRRMSASGGAGARARAGSVAAGRPHVDVDGAECRDGGASAAAPASSSAVGGRTWKSTMREGSHPTAARRDDGPDVGREELPGDGSCSYVNRRLRPAGRSASRRRRRGCG